MRNRLTDAERQSRAAIDGRVAFASCAVALAAGLILLLDRIGLPEMGARWLSILIVALALCIVGVIVRAARISTFYAAARGLPASYAGLALAAVIAGIGLIFLPPLPKGATGGALVLGLIGGVLGLLLFSAPLIRKSGAFSAADLVTARFPSPVARIALVALAAAVAGFAALAGFQQAAGLLSAGLGVSRGLAVLLAGLILALALIPGGLRGLSWSAAACGGMLIAALAGPVLLLTLQDIALPSPWIGSAEAWNHAAERMNAWGGVGAGAGPLWLAAPIALGLTAFAPILAFATGCRDRVGAQFAVGAGAIWIAFIGFFAVMTLALAAIGLDVALIGQRADRLPEVFYSASSEGWLSICGQSVSGPAQARAACAGAPGLLLRSQDVAAEIPFLLFGLADTQGMSSAWRAFALAGWLGAALALAAAGLQGAATALGHDLLYRMRDRAVITSRRLATTRLMLVACIAVAAIACLRFEPDPRLCVAAALVLSATGMSPLLVLSLWPRAGSAEAILALITGLGVAGAVVLDAFDTTGLTPEALGFAALAGAGCALAAGLALSLRPGVSSDRGVRFRDSILHAGADALTPDRGA